MDLLLVDGNLLHVSYSYGHAERSRRLINLHGQVDLINALQDASSLMAVRDMINYSLESA